MSGKANYGELELCFLERRAEAIEVELRVNDPDSQGELASAHGQINVPTDELLTELFGLQNDPDAYGQKLAEYVFASADIRERFGESKAAFESRGMEIRLRIQINSSISGLHGIGWELLRDPKTGGTLATSERIVFSRFILSRDWRAIKPRPKADLKALIAVASPTDLAKHKLATVNVELEQARESLAELKTEFD